MTKKILYSLAIVSIALASILSLPQTVSATAPPPPSKPSTPAAGSWAWDTTEVTGVVIPQYQLAKTYDPDYALMQSPGLSVDGPAKICHPYPGGQFGWTAEIRTLTSTGWQAVPTTNQWLPDEEGKFMTCANVWSSGTYAVFGYWEKPEGWGVVDHFCAAAPEGAEYYGAVPVTELRTSFATVSFSPPLTCSTDPEKLGFFTFVTGGESFVSVLGFYCGCNAIYYLEGFLPGGIQ